MMNAKVIKCPNCGADVNAEADTAICDYCRSKVFVDLVTKINNINVTTSGGNNYAEISEKLNSILKLYIGNKNEMFLMLKDRIGLVNSGRTTAKIAMMQTANTYEEEEYNAPFTYRIGDRTLDHFEYKSDNVVELTYESDEDGFFAVEYYGKITKYNDLNELSSVLDEIIEEVKAKFKQ